MSTSLTARRSKSLRSISCLLPHARSKCARSRQTADNYPAKTEIFLAGATPFRPSSTPAHLETKFFLDTPPPICHSKPIACGIPRAVPAASF